MPGLVGGTGLPVLCFAPAQVCGAAPAHLPGAGRLLHPPPGAGLCHRSARSHRQRAHRFGEEWPGSEMGDSNPSGGQDAAVGDMGRDGRDVPVTCPPQLVLLPRYSSLEMFIAGDPSSMERRETFERYRCAQPFYTMGPSPVAEPCSSLLHSLSAILHDGALREYSPAPCPVPRPAPHGSRCSPCSLPAACLCDPQGSLSAECRPQGGQCRCKLNVVGRRCHRCSPGTFGFGPGGCRGECRKAVPAQPGEEPRHPGAGGAGEGCSLQPRGRRRGCRAFQRASAAARGR